MAKPALYEEYDRHTVIGMFGDESKARSLCDGQWILWSDTAICFADLGNPPLKSHFTNGATFVWVADKPYRVSGNKHTPFVPSEVVGKVGLKRAIWLFVRPTPSGKYRFLGKLTSSHMQSIGGKPNHGEAQFELVPTLPSQIWSQIGEFHFGDVDHAAVDAALGRLGTAIGMNERLDILKTLVRYWHGEIRPEDGIPEEDLLGMELPTALRWWYRFAGRRTEILSGQNSLLPPALLSKPSEGLLVFYGENQWCYEWATLQDGDDPPVFGREGSPLPWEPEGIMLSEHLILACLFEGTMCHCRYGASAAWLDGETLARIVEQIPPLAINGWHWCEETRFFAKNGAFMYTMYNGEIKDRKGYSVWVGAKTEQPLQFLKPMLDDEWEYQAI